MKRLAYMAIFNAFLVGFNMGSIVFAGVVGIRVTALLLSIIALAVCLPLHPQEAA